MRIPVSGLATALAIAAALLAPASSVPAATVYKWVDDKGVVNYSTAPPPTARNAVAINAAPALESAGLSATDEEARYWRDRRQRETQRDSRDYQDLRLRRETEELRQLQIRQQMQLSAQAASADDERRRLAREQCLRERRVDCDGGGIANYTPYTPAPVVVRASRQSIQQAAPFPVSGSGIGPAPGTIAGTQAQLAPFRSVRTTATAGYSFRSR